MYETPDGKVPFSDWMDVAEGSRINGIIMQRMDRVEDGNLGDWNPVGEGVGEFVFDVEGGYLGQDGDIIVLLCVGMKRTQTRDIALARKYWREYNA